MRYIIFLLELYKYFIFEINKILYYSFISSNYQPTSQHIIPQQAK